MIPSSGESAHYAGVNGVAHGVLGAGVSVALQCAGAPLLVASIATSIGYVFLKECRDLRNGGTRRDSLEDSAFVWVGSIYSGPFVWPWSMLVSGGLKMVFRKMRDPAA